MKERLQKLRRLFGRDDKLRLIKLFVLMAIGSVMDVIGVGAVPAFVASLSMPETVMAHPMVAPVLSYLNIVDARQMVLWIAVGLIVIYVAKNLFLIFVGHVRTKTVEHFKISMTLRLFDAYARAPYEFHLQRNSAELLRNLTMETNTVVANVVGQILSLTMAVMMTTMIVALMVVATPGIAVAAVIFVGFGSWLFLRVVRAALHRYGVQAQAERKKSIQFINQALGGILEARVLGAMDYFVRRYHQSDKNWASARQHFQFINSSSKPVLETIAVLGILLIVIAVVTMGADLSTLMPTLSLLGIAVMRLRVTIGTIVNGVSAMRYNMVAVDPVYDDMMLLLDGKIRRMPSLPGPGSSSVLRSPFDTALQVKNVSYRYPNTDSDVLKNIDLTIKKGSAVGFVGSTGSGKSTLINILLGILEPKSGGITIDGKDIFDDIDGWRKNVGYIPQVIFLLDDSIRRNVAFGIEDEQIDDDKVREAVRAAQLESFVDTLDAGLDTVVGESGARLSGGQRQRIGLARALYHNPSVLIMDEATSSLDNQTENLVMEALNSLRAERTFIMIAHRLSTVEDCDTLYFMKNGEIVDQGTYEELDIRNLEFNQMTRVS